MHKGTEQMGRLIDANELKKSIKASVTRLDFWEIDKMEELVDSAPTVELRKEGRWLKTSQESQLRCSACDRICYIAIYPWFKGQATYCPSCGAEMK